MKVTIVSLSVLVVLLIGLVVFLIECVISKSSNKEDERFVEVKGGQGMWKAVLAIWGSTAIAIGIALYYTHDMRCLWFLLVPACMRISSNDKTKSEDEK